jgi:putative CocE/NonD family hydrolase
MTDSLAAPADYARRVGPRYRKSHRSSFYIPMRDGVRIAIDLHLPRELRGAKVPAIVRQTRYFRGMKTRTFVPQSRLDPVNGAIRSFFIERGYAWIDVDVRGSGASFGSWVTPWSPDEVKDGAEIVDWIVQQSWSNGRVGAMGNSYDGTAAELLGTCGHPGLRAIAPRCALFDVYSDIAYPGGIRHRWFVRTWNRANTALDANHPEQLAADVLGIAHPPLEGPRARRLLRSVFSKALLGVRPVDDDPHEESLAKALAERTRNMDVDGVATSVEYRDDVHEVELDGDRTMALFSPSTYVDRLRASGVAVLGIGGWMDGAYPHAAIKRHLTLGTENSQLLIGPWNHGVGFQSSPHATDRRVRFHLAGELLRFFDEHLKGVDTGHSKEARVRWFTMGKERWRSGNEWPPRGTRPMRLYLEANRALVRQAPERGSDRYAVDREAGTGRRTRWRTLVSPLLVPDYPNRARHSERLLVYASAPLEHDLEVTGHPLATLYLRANARDGAVFVYLEEETASGKVLYVTEGQLRLQHRDLDETSARLFRSPAPYRSFTRGSAKPLVPGELTRVVVDLVPTSFLFSKGSRIRLALGGADVDHFDPVPSAATELAFERGGDHASFLELPVL